MAWQAICESELQDEIRAAECRMSAEQAGLWMAIKIVPEKWRQVPYGDEGGGFWAVAILGRQVIWYNDIEEGFNVSSYQRFGEIDEYLCSQDKLQWAVQHLIDFIRYGQSGPARGLPVSVK